MKKNFDSHEEALNGFFEYLSVNKDHKQTRDLLKMIEFKNKNLHPREKKRMKNQLNKSISREITPSSKSLRKKSPKRVFESQIITVKPEEDHD